MCALKFATKILYTYTSTHTNVCANVFAETKAMATLTPNDKLERGQLCTEKEMLSRSMHAAIHISFIAAASCSYI